MSFTRQEELWNSRREQLKRLRGEVHQYDERGRHSTDQMLADRSYARQHTPPAYLPRLDTPPEHDNLRQGSNLRGRKYEVVPPVRPKHNAFERSQSVDSWGQVDDSQEGPQNTPYAHHPIPAPYPYTTPYPYPVYPMLQAGYQPAPVFIQAPPIPVYMPTQHKKKHKIPGNQEYKSSGYRNSQRDQATFTIEDKGTQFSEEFDRPRPRTKFNFDETYKYHTKFSRHRNDYPDTNGHTSRHVHYSSPLGVHYRSPENEDRHSKTPNFSYISTRDVFDEDKNSVLQRYKYEYPQYRYREEHAYPDDDKVHATEVALYFNSHPAFAETFLHSFIDDCLEEEIIPDLLIEILSNSNTQDLYQTSYQNGDYDLSQLTAGELKQLDRQRAAAFSDQYMLKKLSERDPITDCLTELIDDVVHEGCVEVVRTSTQELVKDYLHDSAQQAVVTSLVDEYMQELGEELLRFSKEELVLEDIADEMLEEHVSQEIGEVALDVLTHYDSKIQRRELREVAKYASQKLIDSLCVEYLLSALARQGTLWTEDDHANKLLDSLMLNILLEEFFGVKQEKEKTTKNQPLKKLHEKIVTDVALDVLLSEMTETLDQDIQDLDEYERGDANHDFDRGPQVAVNYVLGR